MDYKSYERKINDVIMKCPIEVGVEILVYNILDSIVGSKKFSLVDINRIRMNRDKRLTTHLGVPDIAILSNDFEYGTQKGKVYGFVEVKSTNVLLKETKQIIEQKRKKKHCIYTNGLVWRYYKNGEKEWEMVIAYLNGKECKSINDFNPISIDIIRFDKMIENLKLIDWDGV